MSRAQGAPAPSLKTHEEVIGTRSGNVWHQNRNELSCVPCSRAAAVYQQEVRQRGKCAPGLGWPLLPAAKQRLRKKKTI
jgi:hypothetical protein